MIRRPLSRRAALRGAGVAVGLPLLEAMLPRSARAADAAATRRLVIFYTPNGTNDEKRFVPSTTGTGFTLDRETDPLLPHKQDLLVISGLNMYTNRDPGDQHSVGMGRMLTCSKTSVMPGYAKPGGADVGFASGISIDQKIAQAIGMQTKFPSLELGVQTVLGIGAHPFSRMVYKGPQQPVPAEDDPRQVWKRLFADLQVSSGAAPAMPAVDLAREQRKSVLDFVRGSYEKLSPRLGGGDFKRVDDHLAFIREIEKRLAVPPAVVSAGPGCTRPAEPTAINPMDPAQFPAIGKLQMDLLTLALACDLTRVASLQWSWARSSMTLPWAGIRDGHHDLSHTFDAAYETDMYLINRYYAQQLAYLATAMKGVSEAGGTLLGNSVVWWCSDVSVGDTHSWDDIRVFLLGGCGGFFKTGQHVKFPGVHHNKLMVSFMRAMGITDAMTFGDPGPEPGPLVGVS